MNTDVNINIGDIESFTKTSEDVKKVTDSILWRVTRSFLLTGGLIYGLLCLMLLCFQDSLIFSPSRIIEKVPVENGHTFHNLVLKSTDNRKINGWFITSQENMGTVLYCRGNKGNMSHDIEVINLWNKAGYNILMFDYQGYGLSQGETSEEHCYEDAQAAYNWLKSKGYIYRNFLIHGKSIGGPVAVRLAQENSCKGIILESTFTSMKDLGSTKLPYLPSKILLHNEFDTKAALASIDKPVLVMHSPSDEIIPYKMSRQLFDTASGTKRFFPLTGKHADGYKNTPGYIRAIKDFADSLTLE